MSTFEGSFYVFLIGFAVAAPYASWKLSRTPEGRAYLKIFGFPFGLQLACLVVLSLVEYDALGILPMGLWTLLRVLCWVGSVFGAFALQVQLLYRSSAFSRLSRGVLRLLVFAALSFPITVTGLVVGHSIFSLAGHGLLFD